MSRSFCETWNTDDAIEIRLEIEFNRQSLPSPNFPTAGFLVTCALVTRITEATTIATARQDVTIHALM